MWAICEVQCLEFGMFGMWDMWGARRSNAELECLACRTIERWDIRGVRYLGCGMFEMWDVGCLLGYGM